jgi:putative ubiquitin-RnfH superfamily antitoxin RatB of RatAB toxin-antitoxin module
MEHEVSLQVTVVYSPAPRESREIALTLEVGATVQQALQASGLAVLMPTLDLKKSVVGVWGRKVGLDHVLHEHDRVEVYRPLRVNPKTARRERFAQQGSRGAGLFASQRAGAKAGY